MAYSTWVGNGRKEANGSAAKFGRVGRERGDGVSESERDRRGETQHTSPARNLQSGS